MCARGVKNRNVKKTLEKKVTLSKTKTKHKDFWEEIRTNLVVRTFFPETNLFLIVRFVFLLVL